MSNEEKKLIPINFTNDLAVRSPQGRIREMVNFDNQANEFFRINDLLKEINEKFFNGKGTINEPHPYYGMKVDEVKKRGDAKASRFDSLFGQMANLWYTSVDISLNVKSKDLQLKNKDFASLALTVSHDLYPDEATFSLEIQGGIWFSNSRSFGGDWGGESLYLKKTGENRELSFSLTNPPSPDSVFLALGKNVEEILQGLAAQGYITMPEVKSATDVPDAPEVPETRSEI